MTAGNLQGLVSEGGFWYPCGEFFLASIGLLPVEGGIAMVSPPPHLLG